MPIPSQKVVLTIPENKRQLIALIVEDLCKNTAFLESQQNKRRLVVTGEEPVSVEVTPAVTTEREDLRTNHEDADNKQAHQITSLCWAEA